MSATVGWTIYVKSTVGHYGEVRDKIAGVFRGRYSEACAWCKAENADKREQSRGPFAEGPAPEFRVVAPLDAVRWAFAEGRYPVFG